MPAINKNINDKISISLYLVRDTHENGMTLKEYADAVISGEHTILDHDNFVYQFGSTDENLQKIVSWATSKNLIVVEAHHGQSVVKVEGPVEIFNDLFNITLQDVTEDGRTYMMPDTIPTIPAEIENIIESVPGFDQSFLAIKHIVEADISTANPNLAVTPVQMATAYNVPSGNGYGATIGIFELSLDPAVLSGYNEGWQQPDVTASFSRIGLAAPTITTVNVNNAYFSPTSTGETMLDIYCAGAVAPKAKIVYYIAPNAGTQNIIDCINATVNDTVNNPTSLGISWGIGDGTQYDSAFQAAIVKGITCFVASGDSGANNLSMAASCCSQYMISAGGTTVVLNGSNQITSEVAWSGSGGGISASIARPSWQSGLTYTTKTASSTGSPTALPRRGIPDISAPADPNTGYVFYYGGTSSTRAASTNQIGGTSASAPLLAGIWARLSQQLGQRIPFNMSIWYLNNTTLFNDITSGDNRNGLTTGYITTSGWDPVTGVGTPKVNQIYKYFHTGSTFPKTNYGFRPALGPTYPRQTTGVR
jgi:kumamolisin